MKCYKDPNSDSKVELLAPAKDKKTAIAAINCGADAIYIGASGFGARKNAANSLEDLKEIVDYAHKFNVRVHVTVNTILTDIELKETQKLIEELYKIGVDVIIVQDMGILKLAIDGELPPIEIHASTQCDNRTLEKVKFFKNIGVSRVILARELSLNQIEEICESLNPTLTSSHTLLSSPLKVEEEYQKPIEVETFVHGALCVSYSGQCYMSCALGGRSANRGECAQPCRKKYQLMDEDGKIYAKDKHLLSLKDFNASKHIERLIEVGVKSFKIEGRLKDENYVKNVVSFYRQEIDKYAQKTSSGEVFCDFEPDVNKSFNRGFTDYFLDKREKCFNFDTPKSLGEKVGKAGKIGRDYFELLQFNGANTVELGPQDGLCYGAEGFLVNKVEGNKIFPNKMGNLKTGDVIFRNFDAKFEKLLTNTKTKRRIGVDFECKNGILTAIDEDENTVSVELSAGEVPKNPDKMKETFISQLQKTGESDFYVKKVQINHEIPFLPVSMINEIRRNILEKLLAERLKNYRRVEQKPLKYADFSVEKLDYHANICNKSAKSFYENCGCEVCEFAPEKCLRELREASETKLSSLLIKSELRSARDGEALAAKTRFDTKDFKNKELMRTKHCLKFAFDMCKSPKKLYLIDEKGKKYPLIFDCKNCEMVVCS